MTEYSAQCVGPEIFTGRKDDRPYAANDWLDGFLCRQRQGRGWLFGLRFVAEKKVDYRAVQLVGDIGE